MEFRFSYLQLKCFCEKHKITLDQIGEINLLGFNVIEDMAYFGFRGWCELNKKEFLEDQAKAEIMEFLCADPENLSRVYAAFMDSMVKMTAAIETAMGQKKQTEQPGTV